MSDTGVTQLLERWAQGDHDAVEALAPMVDAELRRIADRYLQRERSGHTLQPTALVNEAWLRLVRQDRPNFENRQRFFALAAQMMRHVLVDYARRAGATKRSGERVELHDTIADGGLQLDRFLVLDQALDHLARFSPRQANVIELHYFGGLKLDEIAHLLGVSAATISREQQAAEAWLSQAVT